MTKLKWPTKQGKNFEIPLFSGNMWVFYDRDTYRQALDFLNCEGKEPLEAFGGIVMHVTNNSDGCLYLVGIFSHTLGIVCHESVHVAQYVMDYAGSRDDETEAYLAQRCFEFIEKHMPKGETDV